MRFIRADENLTIDIKPAADAMLAALDNSGVQFNDDSQQDFIHGNIKARQRMIAQYAVAGARAGVVIGTDHAAESVMGFFTKFGDGGADVLPLTGLNKRRVRAVAKALGAPEALAHKVPTADLEMLRPLRPDEDAYGIPYDDIDDFLEDKPVSDAARATILRFYDGSQHKRALPYTPFDWPAETSVEPTQVGKKKNDEHVRVITRRVLKQAGTPRSGDGRRFVAEQIGARFERQAAQLLAVNLPRDHIAHIWHFRVQFDGGISAGLACVDDLDVFRVMPQLALQEIPHFLLAARFRDIAHDQVHTAYPLRAHSAIRGLHAHRAQRGTLFRLSGRQLADQCGAGGTQSSQ